MGIDLDAYREQSRETWGRMAGGWEARREWLMGVTAPVSDWLVGHAGTQPGQTVLELAAGPGDLGFRIAEQLGDSGRLICTDFAPEMLEVARRNGDARGLGNVEYRVLDAERMDLGEDSADAAVCRWGYMLMADPGAALKETRRVLRGGGRLCFAVWMTADRNPWAAIPAITLVQRGHMDPPNPAAPSMFGMGDAARTRELVTAAGFAEPELEEISFSYTYRDFDDFWKAMMQLAGPLARVVEQLPEQEREATRAAVRENVSGHCGQDGSYSFPAASWGVLAR